MLMEKHGGGVKSDASSFVQDRYNIAVRTEEHRDGSTGGGGAQRREGHASADAQ
jgi:hypothetical protein